MSYYPNQGQGGYPPQQNYGQPPNQYPPPTGSPYPPQQPPQQQGWGQPPPNQYGPPPGQQPYGAPPPGQYPPPQQGYGAPPPQQWNQPPPNQYGPPQGQQPYGAPPPGQYPPQQGYGAPPPGQYGAPPPGQYGAPPPGQYGAPPPGQYGAPQGAPGQFGAMGPSPGYGPALVPVNVTNDVQALYKAMKGFGTDEAKLNRVLAKATPDQVNAMREEYSRTYREDLIKRLESETSGNYEDLLVHIARGPLLGDVWALKGAMKGMGTKESVLNDVLVGRTNADMNAIKTEYQRVHRTSLEADLKSDLSAATEKMFLMITAARRNENNVPTIPQQIEQDVTDLQKAFGNFVTKDPVLASQILTSRNDDQLRAIAYTYEQRFREPLSRAVKKSFTGHMEEALMLLLARAQNRALSDATQLEDSMAGVGTKNTLLIQRVVRAHWDPMHMARVRTEYQNKYKTDLVRRIKGETSGHYEKLLVACVE